MSRYPKKYLKPRKPIDSQPAAGAPGMFVPEEDGSLRALSLVCTHMACTVVWNPGKKEFHCPCHDALFDSQGNVLSGPPPSPLARWKIQVMGDKILVGGGW